jgi:hypothetical protein
MGRYVLKFNVTIVDEEVFIVLNLPGYLPLLWLLHRTHLYLVVDSLHPVEVVPHQLRFVLV